MADNTSLRVDDVVTVRWRDVNGTFDAAELKIVGIMKTNVSSVDQGQLWIPLERLQKMMQVPDEATIIVTGQDSGNNGPQPGFVFRDKKYLTQDFNDMMQVEKFGSAIMYVVLLALALLAIFDTQVLSIFRRRKEIGTLIALGMTRGACHTPVYDRRCLARYSCSLCCGSLRHSVIVHAGSLGYSHA